jgi:hypothetical protein
MTVDVLTIGVEGCLQELLGSDEPRLEKHLATVGTQGDKHLGGAQHVARAVLHAAPAAVQMLAGHEKREGVKDLARRCGSRCCQGAQGQGRIQGIGGERWHHPPTARLSGLPQKIAHT